ncbi:hypothetical protein [Ureibacillus thermosphaericus]|uniref:Uncharacterized protein n=1 Tax=Ureibacillus thermosphaericus TaxID=51173 RepID=A0A840PS77_URETH|nr:hypothetical protein [Ureibacillus thermosphaericus]MBB5148014.1 hypothetical protein [Ureibacillus thermosphaericus]NKZ30725.1 hypothetical protein [Ureibacillus thermosphaericus]
MVSLLKEETHSQPIGSITCTLVTPLYRKEGDRLIESKEYLDKGTTKYLYRVEGNIGEIEGGLYIKDIDRKQFIISLGELEVLGDHVRTCSRNGIILRKLKKGMKYRVVSIHQKENGVMIYGINDKEFISSDEEITFQKFIPQLPLTKHV